MENSPLDPTAPPEQSAIFEEMLRGLNANEFDTQLRGSHLLSLCRGLSAFESYVTSIYADPWNRPGAFVFLSDEVPDFAEVALRVQSLGLPLAVTCARECEIPALAVPDRFEMELPPPYFMLRRSNPLYGMARSFPAPSLSPNGALFMAVEHFRHYARSHVVLTCLLEKRYRRLIRRLDEIVSALLKYFAELEGRLPDNLRRLSFRAICRIVDEEVKDVALRYFDERYRFRPQEDRDLTKVLAVVWRFEHLIQALHAKCEGENRI